MFLAGIAIIAGFVLPAYIPENYRIIVGVILVLYGFYRTALLLMKYKRAKQLGE